MSLSGDIGIELLQGVHIMPLGWTDIVPEILKQSEIDIRQSAFNWRMA